MASNLSLRRKTMRRIIAGLWSVLLVVMPCVAWAEESHGYSRGNAFIYYAAIAAVLIYGVHDVFHKKVITWAAAVVIPITFYMLLPAK
jgi:hypothetical protein